MIEHFGCDSTSMTEAGTNDVHFTKDELNALRYASGFVPLKLLRKYERKKGEKFDQFDQFEMCLVKSLISLKCVLEKWLSWENQQTLPNTLQSGLT